DRPEGLAGLCRDERVVPVDPSVRPAALRALRYLSPQPISTLPIAPMRAEVDRLLRGCTWDAVIASTETMATYVLRAPRGVARILEEHNAFSRWMGDRHAAATGRLSRAQTWVSWQKTRAYERRLFPHFDMVTMVAAQDRDASLELVAGDKPPIAVVPNGVDCEHNRPGFASPRPGSLVYNGAMTYSANYDAIRFFLRDVYPQVRARVPGATLTITGSTADVDLTGLALDDSVRLSGYVDDVRPVIGGSAVCVVPLRQGSGTRLKILEAMALGVPVVSTRKGAEGLDVMDGEHLLLADNSHDLAEAAVRALEDESLRTMLSINARALVEERYDWRAIGAGFSRLVEEAVGRKREAAHV
ncbi:MAG: glycosyltransferase, partial [Anaerolineae bacterium]